MYSNAEHGFDRLVGLSPVLDAERSVYARYSNNQNFAVISLLPAQRQQDGLVIQVKGSHSRVGAHVLTFVTTPARPY